MSEAIILAGGLGTRLKSVLTDVPKPMAPINGKPFLFYLLNYLDNQNIGRVILSVGYKHESISAYFGARFKSMEIRYSIEDEPLGTGGAILLALNKSAEDQVFVLNGDTFFPVSLNRLMDTHLKVGAETTIALKKLDQADRFGTVSVGNDFFIRSFREKIESGESLINGGIYCLDRQKFLNHTFVGKFSFEKDYLEPEALQHRIAGVVFDDYFLDIGIPESLRKANEDFGSVMGF